MIAYLDMPSGISGDMFLGCLVDAGWPVQQLREAIARLALPDGSWRIWYASRPAPPFDHKYFAIGTASWADAHVGD